MKNRLQIITSGILLALTCVSLATRVMADGDIGFLPTPTTIVAGQPFSWLEVGHDWNRIVDGTTDIGGVTYANPTTRQIIRVESSSDATHLIMIFTIPDQTRRLATGTPNGTTLRVGDKIIIQLDPDYSRSTGLSSGLINSSGTDYRFEIVIRDNDIDLGETGYKLPEVIGGGLPNNWAVATTSLSGLASITQTSAEYQVTVRIPLAFIGITSPVTTRIGITFAVINDLGNFHCQASGTSPECGGTARRIDQLTGTTFPSSMGLSTTINDIGVFTTASSSVSSGTWLNPSQWGTGYFQVVPGDVQFSHSPSYYFSEDIRIGICSTQKWDDIQPVVDQNTNQLTLAGWYKYNPGIGATDKPCQMRIWFRVRKSITMSAAVKRRFLIVWGRPGIAPQEWFTATLTAPLTIGANIEIFNFLWGDVPKVNFTAHPCLRIYALPENLDQTDPTSGVLMNESRIGMVQSDDDLRKVERAYGFPSYEDPRSAQMNFTALQPGTNCVTTECQQQVTMKRMENTLTEEHLRFRKIGLGFIEPDATTNSVDEGAATPQQKDAVVIGGEEGKFVRITMEGIGVETPSAQRPYVYLKTLGGLGWLLSQRDLQRNKSLNLEFEVSNPLLLRRDLTQRPPVETKSPARDIYLVIKVEASPGVPPPKIKVTPGKQHLEPGETTKATITVIPGTDGGIGSTGVKPRFGISLHAGGSFPQGAFNQVADAGGNVAVDFEVRANNTVSAELIFGYHRFLSAGLGPDLSLYQVSGNLKFYTPGTFARFFVNGGPGSYRFDPGTTEVGGNVGGGIQFNLTSRFAIEGAYNWHVVNTSGASVKFSTAQAGVRYRF